MAEPNRPPDDIAENVTNRGARDGVRKRLCDGEWEREWRRGGRVEKGKELGRNVGMD